MEFSSKYHSGIIGYSIDNRGNLIVRSLKQVVLLKAEIFEYQLIKGNDYDQDVVTKTSFKPKEYQASLASIIVEGKTPSFFIPPNAINITYNNPPKALGKPNKFDVDIKKSTRLKKIK